MGRRTTVNSTPPTPITPQGKPTKGTIVTPQPAKPLAAKKSTTAKMPAMKKGGRKC
jgi:hypothetical protein